MLIAEFCQQSGLTRDAVRLYVRLGLVRPTVNVGNRYQHFTKADVERVALIRLGQQLGFTLKQIVELNREYEAGGMDTRRKLAVMRQQLDAVEAQAARVEVMRGYLRRKVAWLENGGLGDEPAFCSDAARTPPVAA